VNIYPLLPVFCPADHDLITLPHPACFHDFDHIPFQDKNSIHPAFRGQQPTPIAQMQIFRVVRCAMELPGDNAIGRRRLNPDYRGRDER
jgi:hypothetical protein